MPESIEVPDLVAGTDARGAMRIDRRRPDPPRGVPLILIGGMTQTLSSWAGHMRPMSSRREVIAYEARGQGSSTLSVARCGPAEHVRDLLHLLEALELTEPVDVAGFSFGGRVAMAFAATHPDRVRRLVLSGVALDRGIVGRLIIGGWIATLRTGDLEALARVSLPDILGPTYLEQHGDMVEAMVKAATMRNDFGGIKALFEGMLDLPADSPWQPEALAERIRIPTLVLGGELDRLAPPAEVAALAAAIGAEHRVFADAGHTIAIEAAAQWREAVERFLDAADAT